MTRLNRSKLAVSSLAAIALSLFASAVAFADSLGPWQPK
jgi:hypothetical protein